jgi:hypothetical protein
MVVTNKGGNKMKESYFAKYKGSNGISIARGTPGWFVGPSYPPLFPTWELINLAKAGGIEEYTRRYYEEVLKPLDPRQVIDDLNSLVNGEPVLLCWEKPGDFCHRHLVIKWLKNYKRSE